MTQPTIHAKTIFSPFEKFKNFTRPVGKLISQKIRSLFSLRPVRQSKASLPLKKHACQFKVHQLEIDLSGLDSNFVLLKLILKRLCKIPEIMHLCKSAFGGDPFKVVFAAQTDIFSEGECSFASKTIRIAKNQNLEQIISTLLFELCNAANPLLAHLSLSQFTSADEYAFAMENAEYRSYQHHLRLLSTILKYSEFVNTLEGVGANPFSFQIEILNGFRTFNEYWQAANTPTQNQPCSHSDFYRRHFKGFKQEPFISVQTDFSSLFISNEAKELFNAIKQNSAAFALLQQYQKPIVACLANNTNQHNLLKFKALNVNEQTCFIRKFCELKNQLMLQHSSKATLAY